MEEVKALRSRLEELCQQTLYYEPGEEGQMEGAEAEEEEGEEEADADLQPPLKRKVTIRSMEGDRLPGGRTMSEDAALRWALRCAQWMTHPQRVMTHPQISLPFLPNVRVVSICGRAGRRAEAACETETLSKRRVTAASYDRDHSCWMPIKIHPWCGAQ